MLWSENLDSLTKNFIHVKILVHAEISKAAQFHKIQLLIISVFTIPLLDYLYNLYVCSN